MGVQVPPPAPQQIQEVEMEIKEKKTTGLKREFEIIITNKTIDANNNCVDLGTFVDSEETPFRTFMG